MEKDSELEPKVLAEKLKHVADEDLLEKFDKVVQAERKITHYILRYIAEIDRRRLYLKFAYSSLFDFLNKHYGYSPAAAMRRIDGARLLQEIPELAQKIEQGAINLTQAASIQSAARTAYKETLIKVDSSIKKNLLQKIENTSHAETQVLLAKELDLSHSAFEKQRLHRDESVTLNLNFPKEDIKMMEKAKQLHSHSVPSGKWTDYFTYISEKELKTYKNMNCYEETQSLNNSQGSHNFSCDHPDPVSRSKVFLSSRQKKKLIQQSSGCVYIDPKTGKCCGSRYQLQVDHIKPKWAGGDDSPDNLQVLCGAHNRFKYKQEASIKYRST